MRVLSRWYVIKLILHILIASGLKIMQKVEKPFPPRHHEHLIIITSFKCQINTIDCIKAFSNMLLDPFVALFMAKNSTKGKVQCYERLQRLRVLNDVVRCYEIHARSTVRTV